MKTFFLKFLFIFSIIFSYLHADVVSNRTNFSFYAPPNEQLTFLNMYLNGAEQKVYKPKVVYWKDLNPKKNKFLFMYFFDIYCPPTVKNIPTLHQVLAYINYYYPNIVKPILVEALKRNWAIVKDFIYKTGLRGIPYYMSPNMNINEYLNVKSTPTVIIMDPNGNIVDKIHGNKLPIVYITHLDYIIGQYMLAHGIRTINGLDVNELIQLNPNSILKRYKEALVNAGLITEEQANKIKINAEETNPFENNKDTDY